MTSNSSTFGASSSLTGEPSERSRLLGDSSPSSTTPGCFGVRHLVAFLGFLGFANVYAMRVNLSVAIVAMVNNSAIPHANASTVGVCPLPNTNTSSPQKDGEFVWDEQLQGIILGSFFWGYILTNLVGGRLAELVGGRLVMGVGVFGTAFFTVLSPLFAKWSTTAFVVLRVLEGMCEGVTYPAMSGMLARWIPPLERSRTCAFVYAGSLIGTFISLPVSGFLCDSDLFGGWPSVFFIFGTAGMLWAGVWFFLAADGPEVHPFISCREKEYIAMTLNAPHDKPFKALPIPWKKFLTSLPLCAITVTHFGQAWGFYTILNELPTYMANVLHFDIKQNALLSAFPFLAMWVMGIGSGVVADKLQSKGILSTTATRKLFNSIGSLLPSLLLVVTGYTGCDATLSIAMLTLSVTLSGASYAGYNSSHLDISPNFAGTLMGLTNTVATIPGFVSPIFVGYLVSGDETLARWRLVFWVSAVIVCYCNLFFVIFYAGEVQPWNEQVTAVQPEPDVVPALEDSSEYTTDACASEGSANALPRSPSVF